MTMASPLPPFELAVLGSGTGVGKTWIMGLLAQALRRAGRRVHLHKPIACGGWDGQSAEDGRRLRAWCGDGQDPARVCPREFPEAAAPALAAEAAGTVVTRAMLGQALESCRGPHDLLIEGAGGLLSPLTVDRAGIAAVLPPGIASLVVTTPDLGTLNATALTTREAARLGLRVIGLVVCAVRPDGQDLATRTAVPELERLTGMPVLARVAHQPGGDAAASGPDADTLATAVLARMAHARAGVAGGG